MGSNFEVITAASNNPTSPTSIYLSDDHLHIYSGSQQQANWELDENSDI